MLVLNFLKLNDEDKFKFEEKTIDGMYTYRYVPMDFAGKIPIELYNRISFKWRYALETKKVRDRSLVIIVHTIKIK